MWPLKQIQCEVITIKIKNIIFLLQIRWEMFGTIFYTLTWRVKEVVFFSIQIKRKDLLQYSFQCLSFMSWNLLSLKLWFKVIFRHTARMANLESSLKQGVLFATYCSNFINSEAKEANNISWQWLVSAFKRNLRVRTVSQVVAPPFNSELHNKLQNICRGLACV